MFKYITSMFIVTESILDQSSEYSVVLYCLKTELKCGSDYNFFQLRCDLRNKLDDNSFMNMFKSSLKNMSKVDDNFCNKGLL